MKEVDSATSHVRSLPTDQRIKATFDRLERMPLRLHLTGTGVVFTVHIEMAISVRAHITGTVWKIEVALGDAVSEGQTLVILESMKMEMPIESPSPGRVSAVRTQEGAAVEEGAILIELDPA